jgi:hypothetical protein
MKALKMGLDGGYFPFLCFFQPFFALFDLAPQLSLLHKRDFLKPALPDLSKDHAIAHDRPVHPS